MGVQVGDFKVRDMRIKAEMAGLMVGYWETPLVLMYEIGEITKCLVKAQAYPDDARLYLKLLGPALADTIMQLRLIADEFGFDWEELVQDGADRFVERAEERNKRAD